MTGLWIVLVAVVVALAFGGYRRLTDGRARAVRPADLPADAAGLGVGLGTRATLVQFSSVACAPCAATRRVLGALSTEDPAVAHVDLDVAERLDLVEQYGITRTPTVLVLDAGGAVRHRIVGAPRRDELLAALGQVAPVSAA